MDRKSIYSSIQTVLEQKGKRKFVQSIEAIFNIKGLDVSKPENRIKLEASLPHGRGKETPVIVFAEGQAAQDAKNAGAAQVISKAGIQKLKENKKELKKLAGKSEFLAMPQLMMEVGKNLGKILGGRGKLPKPIAGQPEAAIKQARSRVRLQTRGKHLPTVQCPIGTESMKPEELAENFEAIYEKLKEKVGESSIGSAYLKLTMGPAVKMGAKK